MSEPLMNDEDLRDLIARGRRVAARGGTMHALWDAIFDAEAILAGKPSVMTRETVEACLRRVKE